MEKKQFHINVLTALIMKDLTMGDVAKELGISASYLSDIVKGNRKGEKHKRRIAEYLGFYYPNQEGEA
ncbi:helix-turn-helix domain-containing protein [Niallia taxi]|uniref:helix-turn-helix domain-containing protein n=1 Tax=Niallia taxi TaxID=2499688 RepID=UPI00254ADD41|nr:helix-turn-helix transcriptional regulator [Niallia taxi]MDK8641304.1 helix-turn-helix transcriptional regulator [Niallia taxi]